MRRGKQNEKQTNSSTRSTRTRADVQAHAEQIRAHAQGPATVAYGARAGTRADCMGVLGGGMSEPKFKRIEKSGGFGFILEPARKGPPPGVPMSVKPESESSSYEIPLDDVGDWDEHAPESVDTKAHRPAYAVEPDIFEADPPVLAEGVQFAKLYGELRRVREDLKAITEDRDYWLEVAEARHAELLRTSGTVKSEWQGDEGKVLSMIVGRLKMGAGQYGALDVHDGRDMVQEGTEEILDMAVYLACKMVALSEGQR